MGFLNAIVTHIAPLFIITSPITSYADQIHSIHRSRTSAGFSLDIPLIMLVASTLKLFYWIEERFATSLLLQAALMILVQSLLLHVALLHRPSPYASSYVPFTPSPDKRPFDFWQWTQTRPYWFFLASFAGALCVLQLTVGWVPGYSQLLGYVALTIEAMLPLPQLLANSRRRGCRGFRISVLVNWLVGDAFKMWFFFASPADGDGAIPWAFKLCGMFQATCDLLLGVQYLMYGDGPADIGAGTPMRAAGVNGHFAEKKVDPGYSGNQVNGWAEKGRLA